MERRYRCEAVAAESVSEQRAAFASLLTRLGKASPREICKALEGRVAVEAEPGLAPELVERLRRRVADR